jgi:hypothetical protein
MHAVRRKSLSIAATIILVAATILVPVRATSETITINVPVKVNEVMDGVFFRILCNLWDANGKFITQRIRESHPVSGNMDEIVTVKFETEAGTVDSFNCILLINREVNSGVQQRQIEFRKATGAPDDWRYAKPGTVLSVNTDRIPIPKN